LCLQANLWHRLKIMKKKNHEQLSKTPQDLYWWLMTKGERSVDWKACCSVLHLLYLHKSGGTGFQISMAPVLVCLSQFSVSLLSGKLGGTKFPEPVAPVLAVVCNRPL
jgi:hypothetical protein